MVSVMNTRWNSKYAEGKESSEGFGLTAAEHLFRRVDVRLPGKGNSKSHGARPIHLIITTIKWIRTSRLSIQNSPFGGEGVV